MLDVAGAERELDLGLPHRQRHPLAVVLDRDDVRALFRDELGAALDEGAELIDVRERDERDVGYIPGSRNIPYRLLALPDLDVTNDHPVVTICESGARAAIAASLLAARGVAARPVVHGGVNDWVARGGDAVEFRRCGG